MSQDCSGNETRVWLRETIGYQTFHLFHLLKALLFQVTSHTYLVAQLTAASLSTTTDVSPPTIQASDENDDSPAGMEEPELTATN